MRAWLLPSLTGIQSLHLGTAPDPHPSPTQVVLEVHFASLNPADNYLAQGQYPDKPQLPHILGRDALGTVVAVGASVSHIQPGDIRIILRSDVGVTQPGTLADRVAVEADYTAPVPEGWSEEQAAAAPLVYMTAWQALTQWNNDQPPLPQNPITLITGASGGVGVASVQLARALGHKIIALSRSAEKSARLRDLGASWTLDPTNPNWRDELKKLLDSDPSLKTQDPSFKSQDSPLKAPSRVDLAVDNIAGDTFPRVIDVMAAHGRISCVGRLAGPVPSFNTASLFFRRLKIGGVAVGAYTNAEAQAAWQNVLLTLSKTGARPLIDHVFDFGDVPAAFVKLAQGPMGKVLVRIRP